MIKYKIEKNYIIFSQNFYISVYSIFIYIILCYIYIYIDINVYTEALNILTHTENDTHVYTNIHIFLFTGMYI